MKTQTGKKFQIDKDVVAFIFSISQWGNRRVADKGQIESGADKSMLHLTKHLIDSKEYKAIGTFLYDTKSWIISRSVPSFFRDGCYLFRQDMVQRVEEYLKTRQQALSEVIQGLLNVYGVQIEEARGRLAGQFDASDYPDIEELKNMFYWSSQWVSFNVPEGLPENVKQAEITKMQNMWDEAALSITSALREGFSSLISHAIDKLKPDADGKVKIFRDTLVTNILDFLETFNMRNVTNDVELQQLVEKARVVIAGIENTQDLRDNEGLREIVRGQFGEIEKQLDTMVVKRVKRKLDI